jgi:hypothetical protein
MSCINCNGECTQLISDACVRYEGEAFECFDLREGTFDDPVFYNEAFEKLATGFCNFLEQNKVDLSCLYDGSGNPTAPVKEAVERLIFKVCNLSTDDISSRASSYAVGSNSSICGAKLLNRSLEWSTTNFVEGTKFTYSFGNAVSNLPADYSVNSVNVKAIGKSSGSVNTIFANTNKQTGGFNITPDRLPVEVEATVNIDTPCGQVSMSKRIGLGSAQEGSFKTPLDITDTASTTNFGAKNLTQYLEAQSSQISINKNEIDSLKDISIQGCDNVSYPFNDIHTVVQVQGAKVCESLHRLDNIGEEDVLITDCDDKCGRNTYETTIQQALDRLSEIMCKNQERIVDLENEVQELKLKVEKCCDGGGNGTAGSSSGSSGSSGGGGCVGANCADSGGNFNQGGGFGGGGTITGNPNGGNGDGNGNPELCNESPITLDWSYDCTSGLSYTVSGAVGSYTVTMSGASALQGQSFDDGVYVLKVVDSRGCSSSASVSINCCSIGFTSTYDCDSGLVVTISGGSGNVTTTVGGSPYVEGMKLTDGAHTITVTDNTENCSESKIINVECQTDPSPCENVTIDVSADSSNYCTDNSVEVTFTGGTAPYSISVGGTQLASGVPSSPKIVYPSGYDDESVVVEVTDANGCKGSTSVYLPHCVDCTITVGSPISVDWSCDGSNHVLAFAVSRPIGQYDVSITDRDTMTVVKAIVGQSGSQSFTVNMS